METKVSARELSQPTAGRGERAWSADNGKAGGAVGGGRKGALSLRLPCAHCLSLLEPGLCTPDPSVLVSEPHPEPSCDGKGKETSCIYSLRTQMLARPGLLESSQDHRAALVPKF